MAALCCPSLRKAIFDTIIISRAFLSTTPSLAFPNAFNQFVKAQYADIKQHYPSLKGPDLLRKIGEEYRKLSETERLQFKLPEPASQTTESSRYSDKQKKLIYAHKHGLPRRPPSSGLNVYIREKLCDLKGQPISKARVRLQEAVKQWHTLSQTERSVYDEKAQGLKDAYERELEAWASEHGLRYTKNLNLLVSRFYQQRYAGEHAEDKATAPIHSVSTRQSARKKTKQLSV